MTAARYGVAGRGAPAKDRAALLVDARGADCTGRILAFHSEFGRFGPPEERPICRQSKSQPELYTMYRPT